jgi:hypothetical protein
MSEEDPVRWSEGGGPPGSADFVRSIARPPVCPPAIRHVNPTRPRLRTRMIGPGVAVLTVIGGLSLWVLQRPRVEAPPLLGVPVVATTLDAGVRADAALSDAAFADSSMRSSDASSEPDALRTLVRAHHREQVPALVSFSSDVPSDPLEEATICAREHDHACVIRVLEGRARNPRGFALLVEARRALEGREAHARRPSPPAPSDDPLGHWGSLFVESRPSSLVYLDGESTGRMTPLRMDLPAGHYVVGLAGQDGVLHASGCDVVEDQVTRVVRDLR